MYNFCGDSLPLDSLTLTRVLLDVTISTVAMRLILKTNI